MNTVSPTKASFLNIMSVDSLSGVGPKMLLKLHKLGIHHVTDLLFHLPFRYQDKTRITPIIDLRAKQDAQIEGIVQNARKIYGKKIMLTCDVRDHSGMIRCRFFTFSKSQLENIQRAQRIRCFGEVRQVGNFLEMSHPEYRLLDEDSNQPLDECLTPVYHTTEGLGQPMLRKLINQALNLLKRHPLVDYNDTDSQWPDINDAIRYCHQPPPDADTQLLLEGIHPAQQSLAFEELTAHQLGFRKILAKHNQIDAIPLLADQTFSAFQQALPFELTGAQQRVLNDIVDDLAKSKPMNRLLQGDVGSGKTVIAASALFLAIQQGLQAAIMAPTEILAEQHLESMRSFFADFKFNIVLLTGSLTGTEKKQALEKISSGQAQLIIGTHALIQDSVDYHSLSLVVIDEQHRFGVHQRLKLQNKQEHSVHQLVMTATPIPRTLAMTAYAALECSIIDELPPGRTPIETVVLPNSKREAVINRVQSAIDEGKQVYWVCTLIDESEVMTLQAAEELHQQLCQLLPSARIGLIHGKLKSADKDALMQQFYAHKIDCLIATTVIEVGVNVPNASVMVIENSERLGLAQIHQLRGRVGRGSTQSFCVLLYQHPLSEHAQDRLSVIRSSTDGFYIAEEDLRIRGPGDFLGTKQSGLPQYQIADILRDKELLPQACARAKMLAQASPHIANKLIERWLAHKLELMQV